ncbi:hypothetical protein ACWEKR_08905 [Nocardia sp. NPDC004573]|uniref:hypothetical protein n=1 Tax=Nocardia TaxID=1817 RepID=UPI0012F7A93E|nr:MULTISPECIES: hypothetical protein [Nocardia]
MRSLAAIGYIRRDVSGTRQHWDETEIRRLAHDLGYSLAKMAVFGDDVDHPALRLRNLARNMTRVHGVEISAVLTPNLDHLDGDAGPVIEWCDEVVTVDDGATYARTESDVIA